jgi:hypothetical protein
VPGPDRLPRSTVVRAGPVLTATAAFADRAGVELADWRAGRNAICQLAALTIGTRLAVADA